MNSLSAVLNSDRTIMPPQQSLFAVQSGVPYTHIQPGITAVPSSSAGVPAIPGGHGLGMGAGVEFIGPSSKTARASMGQRGYERERDGRGLAGGEAYGQLGHGHSAHQSHLAHQPQHLHSNLHRDLQQVPPHPAAGPSSSIRNGASTCLLRTAGRRNVCQKYRADLTFSCIFQPSSLAL